MDINEWSKILGEKNIIIDEENKKEYLQNVSGLERSVKAILFPSTLEQVLEIVKVANKYKSPIYPISSGRNWGLGSRLPVKNDCAILDLNKMNKIHEVNAEHGYAVVEPGVTQAQLHEYLVKNNIPMIFNVIGSGIDTSLIGNALDRGVGYFSSRAENLFGLEVILGNGEIIKTGFGHFAEAKTTYLYKHGVGPSLEGLFFQSNFGIVTKAGIELIPKYDSHAALLIGLKDQKFFSEYIDVLSNLRKRNIIRTAFHIANRDRSEISTTPLIYDYLISQGMSKDDAIQKAKEIFQKEIGNPWSTIGGLLGTNADIKNTYKEVKNAMKHIATISLITDDMIEIAKKASKIMSFLPFVARKRALLFAVEPMYGYCKGVPTDSAIKSVYWPLGDTSAKDFKNPDSSASGLLYSLPVVPLDGRSLLEVTELANQVLSCAYGFRPYMTFNMINDKCLEGVINIAFPRNNEEKRKAALNAIRALNEEYISKGYIPYRVGIQSMEQIVDANDPFWKTVAELKKVLDPNNIISPGRYNLI